MHMLLLPETLIRLTAADSRLYNSVDVCIHHVWQGSEQC